MYKLIVFLMLVVVAAMCGYMIVDTVGQFGKVHTYKEFTLGLRG